MNKYMVHSAALMIIAMAALLLPATADVLEEWQITATGDATSPDWSADGTWIIWDQGTDAGYDTWRCPAMGGPPEPFITGPGSQNTPEWSPNNDLIVFWNEDIAGNQDIYVISTAGGDVSAATQITTDPADDQWPTWSPDGQWIAFNSLRSGNADIWIVPLDLSEPPRQLTFDPGGDGWPSWSPDGTEIVFTSDRSHYWGDLWAINVQTSALRQITDDDQGQWNPDWSPDGQHIAYTERTGGFDAEVYVMPADGSEPGEPWTFCDKWDEQPTWSPNGQYIAYHSWRTENMEAWAFVYDPLGVAVASVPVPGLATLAQNEPNPFNPTTTIRIHMEQGVTDAHLEIFDVEGRRVRSIALTGGGPSELEVTWDGLNDGGKKLPSGTYLYRVAYEGGVTDARKAVLLK